MTEDRKIGPIIGERYLFSPVGKSTTEPRCKIAAEGHPVQRQRNRILDMFYLFGAAVLLCVLGAGAFIVADIYHVNPLWVIVSFISIGFFAGAREDYRKEFRSPRFVAFLCGWVVINVIVFIALLSLFGWLWLIPALLLEQFLFYMTAYWFFGVPPPS